MVASLMSHVQGKFTGVGSLPGSLMAVPISVMR